MLVQCKIVLLEGATMPSYAKCGDAGADLYPIEDITIPANAIGFKIATGVKIQMPYGYEIQVRPKSGNSINTPIRVILGTVDSGYTGEIGVIVDNLSRWDYRIPKNKAIAQIVLNQVDRISFNHVNELDETDRGEGGFGSTGRGI